MNVLFCKWDATFLRIALDEGHDCYLILDHFDASCREFDENLASRCRHTYTVKSFDSIEELSAVAADLLTAGIAIDRIVSNGEYGHYGSGLLSALLNVSNLSLKTVMLTRDKRAMKHVIKEAGIPSAKFLSIPDISDPGVVATISANLSYPIVLKPSNGVGARFTYKIQSPSECQAALDEIMRSLNPPIYSQQFIAEEFIKGDEYNIDAVWQDGEPVLFSISKYYRPVIEYRTSTIGTKIVSRNRNPELYSELLALNQRVNSAFSISNGLTHMQVLKEPGKPAVFTEIATRHCGGFGCEAIGTRWGVDNREAYIKTLLGSDPKDLSFHESPFEHVGYFNVSPSLSGLVVSTPNIEEIRRVPGVVKAKQLLFEGDTYRNNFGCNWTLLVLLATPTEDDFFATMNHIQQTFTFETRDASQEGS